MFLNSTTLLLIVIAVILFVFFIINIRSFFSRVGGSWSELDKDGKKVGEIHLSQFGPFVWGKSFKKGGYQTFSGWFNGQTLALKRKDFGIDYFRKLNFPDEVLHQLDGSEMAKLEFEYDAQRKKLKGKHYRMQIDLDQNRRPPKITGRIYTKPVERTWSKN